MIEILYIATSTYTAYCDGFLETVKYFAPGRDKHITILSDRLSELDGTKTEDGTPITVIHMFDLLYPCINLHKSYFLQQLDFDADYIFYFDADTKFRNVPNYDWDELFKTMDEGRVLISKHPVYALKDGESLFGWEKKTWIANFCTENLTDRDPNSQAYIGYETYTYVISSFFAANNKTMRALNNLIVRMNRQDLTRSKGYHIPLFMDENYFNALASDFENGVINDGILFSVKQYSQLYGKDRESDFYPESFLYQKNFKDFKTNRR